MSSLSLFRLELPSIHARTPLVCLQQSHCHQLEESSSDVPQWEELVGSLERALRSIGRMVVDDSHLYDDTTDEDSDGDARLAADNADAELSTKYVRRFSFFFFPLSLDILLSDGSFLYI